MKRAKWVWMLLVALAGSASGAALLQGFAEQAAQGEPGGWTRLKERVPFRRSDLMGSLPNHGGAYSLDHFQGLVAEKPSSQWKLEFELGESGALRVALAGQAFQGQPGRTPSTAGNALRGAGLFFQAGENPSVEALSFGSGKKELLPCEGACPYPLPAPTPWK